MCVAHPRLTITQHGGSNYSRYPAVQHLKQHQKQTHVAQKAWHPLRTYLDLGRLSHTPFSCQGRQGHALQEDLQRGPCCSCWASIAAADGRVGGRWVWGARGDPQEGVEGGEDPLCQCLAACLHCMKSENLQYLLHTCAANGAR